MSSKSSNINKILPAYGDEDRMLVIHADDYDGKKSIADAVCVILEPNTRKIIRAWSLAKMLKFGYYQPICSEKDIRNARKVIHRFFSKKEIAGILEQPETPDQEAIQSLIDIPERIKGKISD